MKKKKSKLEKSIFIPPPPVEAAIKHITADGKL